VSSLIIPAQPEMISDMIEEDFILTALGAENTEKEKREFHKLL
jgi:hypothetical protein